MPPDNAANDPAARHDGWQTLRRFLPYLWPADNPALRWRIVGAVVLILAAKAVTLGLPFFYKRAVDLMTIKGGAPLMLALAFVLAYALGRFAGVLFDNLRKAGFPVTIAETAKAGGTNYRVRVGPYAERTKADAAATKLRRDFRLETWVTDSP